MQWVALIFRGCSRYDWVRRRSCKVGGRGRGWSSPSSLSVSSSWSRVRRFLFSRQWWCGRKGGRSRRAPTPLPPKLSSSFCLKTDFTVTSSVLTRVLWWPDASKGQSFSWQQKPPGFYRPHFGQYWGSFSTSCRRLASWHSNWKGFVWFFRELISWISLSFLIFKSNVAPVVLISSYLN